MGAVLAPDHPRIYHITHFDNLASLAAEGALWSDAVMLQRGGPPSAIGMSTIKKRRLEELRMTCHPGTFVGEYVPFYFCPRSIMLYLLHMGNHPELTYRGGQGPIVHLVADLQEAVGWAEAHGQGWGFSLSNAGARYTEFRCSFDDLGEVDWDAVANNDFRSSEVKEGKQAEFLMYQSFPFGLVREIGVHSEVVAQRTKTAVAGIQGAPPIVVRRDWYF
jgi:ssDNA thymidine ADP-ribosyltransferase, DarT